MDIKIMDNIPPQFKKLAESAELYDQSEKVGAKFGLMIDQIGEMDAEIRGVLLGLFKPLDFTKHIMERLEIERGKAEAITQEVNKEIFDTLKSVLKADVPSNSSEISAIESAGDFSIEQHKPEGDEKTESLKAMSDAQNIENKEDILQGIEDSHTEPLVDHLLSK